ncbi:MAG: serine/threonine protein kinase [Chitinispirillaceae bacterium]|nr:serine/threonine protein kinase [Chitinispirillaceae bacterium]
MNGHPGSASPHISVVKIALGKELVSQKQLDECEMLVMKSKMIGLDTTIEEVMVKQGILSAGQLEELSEMVRMAGDGTYFGNYCLGRLIGEGGMGKVYEAVHGFMGRTVAIKVIHSTFSNDKTKIDRFLQEIRALAKLDHPNIVTIYDAGRVNRNYYLTMELLPGPSLKAYVDSRKKGRLSEKEALRVILATAQALGHAHAKNIIHRDVKPENIIFDGKGAPKLTDFGLVMHHDVDHMTLTQEGHWVGSYYYTSPEQVEGRRDVDGRSDIYSLGATLYYALTGRTVYAGNSPNEIMTKHLVGNFVSPRRYCPYLSDRTVMLVHKMLAIKREKRFQSMEAVVSAIAKKSLALKCFWIIFSILAGIGLVGAGMFLERFYNVLLRLLQ